MRREKKLISCLVVTSILFELLLVSLHTYTESWNVALRLSDGSTTAFLPYDLDMVTTDATGSLVTCYGIVYDFTYEDF